MATTTIDWDSLIGQAFEAAGRIVTFRAPWWASVSENGIRAEVSDYDCSICGEHDGQPCQHYDSMMEAIDQALDGGAMADWRDLQEMKAAAARGLA